MFKFYQHKQDIIFGEWRRLMGKLAHCYIYMYIKGGTCPTCTDFSTLGILLNIKVNILQYWFLCFRYTVERMPDAFGAPKVWILSWKTRSSLTVVTFIVYKLQAHLPSGQEGMTPRHTWLSILFEEKLGFSSSSYSCLCIGFTWPDQSTLYILTVGLEWILQLKNFIIIDRAHYIFISFQCSCF